MSDQEPDFSQLEENGGIDTTALNLLAMLRLNPSTTTATLNAGNHQATATTDQCTKCGSTKRQSPSSFSREEPSSKRATLLLPSSATTFSVDDHIHGFTKLPLPPSHALRRTISDPVNSPGAKNLSGAQAQASNSLGNFLNHRLPESFSINSAATSPSQPLYRSVSDPTSGSFPVSDPTSGSFPLVTTATPPPPLAAEREFKTSPGIGDSCLNLKDESPTTKRLKRMKDRLREMSQWWNEVIKEDEEDSGSEDNDNLSKDESESEVTENGRPCQEAVWVERNGECLILHFKCPCGKGYQILLSGKNCYYKLTTF